MSSPSTAASTETHAVPPPAPRPNADVAAHAVDSQGVRKLDAESVKPHVADPAASKKKQKTRPLAATSTKAQTDTPINDLRLISRTAPRRPIRFTEYNWFVPNFAMMYFILSSMNDKVAATRPYADRGSVNDWIPQVSIIWFSVLAIVQTLRAQEIGGLITESQSRFLQRFVAHIPLETITIPGPLVPFFKSLSVCNPGINGHQDVFPALPPFTCEERFCYLPMFVPPGQVNYFAALHLMIPNIPLLLDQFVHLVSYIAAAPANVYSGYTVLRRLFSAARPAAGAHRTNYERNYNSLAFQIRPTGSDGLYNRFSDYMLNKGAMFQQPWIYDVTHDADNTVAPPTPATWITYSDFADFMQANTTLGWMSLFKRGMDGFNAHWKGNAQMLTLHPSESTAPLILFRDVSYAAPANAGLFGVNPLTNANLVPTMTTRARVFSPFVTDEDFEDAQAAQINVRATAIANYTLTLGETAVTRYGEMWNSLPVVEETTAANLVTDYQTMVVSNVFFSAKADQV